MNDNKKWMKRLSTVFWWLIASLPLIFILFNWLQFCLFATSDNGNITALNLAFSNCENSFSDYVIPQLKNSFMDFFDIFNISESMNFLCVIFAWFIQSFLLHLAVDFILILPKIAQKFIDKVCD